MQKAGYRIFLCSQKRGFVVVETHEDALTIMNRLGGIVKIAQKIQLEQWELPFFESNVAYYSLTNYDGQGTNEVLHAIKGKAKKENAKILLVHGRGHIGVEPSKFLKKRMFTNGFEFFQVDHVLYQTIAVTDTRAIEKRDVERPFQEPLEAISIRLARILINLAQVRKGETLLDPFMGIGTILQEAISLEICAMGVDKDEKRVSQAKKNLEWFKKRSSSSSIFQCIRGDSGSLHLFLKTKIDGVATEPYLGPLIKKLPTRQEAQHTMQGLEQMYARVLTSIHQVLKPGGYVSLIVPLFRTREGSHAKMNFPSLIKGLFSVVQFPDVPIPILYNTGKNKVLREIWVLRKKERSSKAI